MTAAITGVGSALPDRIVPNSELEDLGTSDAWIVKRTGIRQRRRLDPDVSLADLAISACHEAMTEAGVAGTDLSHVVVCTTTPDRVTPGVAVEIAHRLGAVRPAAFDIHAACSGFLCGLEYAQALIDSGRTHRVLVCGAEALSRIVDRTDRRTAILFGDAAGAVVVSRVDGAAQAHVRLASDGAQVELAFADATTRLLRMRGSEIYEYAIRAMTEQSRVVLEHCGLTIADLDIFIAHQANARILTAIANALGLPPERLFMNVDKVGNTSAASIPVAMADARSQGRLAPGARMGLAAFGAGVSWGAAVISYCPGA